MTFERSPNRRTAGATFFAERGQAWIAARPQLAADCLDRWALRRDGSPTCGAVALVPPVLLTDGSPAVLKLQPVDDETAGEPIALRAWDGQGAVRLLRDDPASGAMVLERLDAQHTLSGIPDDAQALQTLSELLGRLNAIAAPKGIRRLADIAAAMLQSVPHAITLLSDPAERRLIEKCAAAVSDLLHEPGDRLLHWDLHYDNVLAGRPRRTPITVRRRGWPSIPSHLPEIPVSRTARQRGPPFPTEPPRTPYSSTTEMPPTSRHAAWRECQCGLDPGQGRRCAATAAAARAARPLTPSLV